MAAAASQRILDLSDDRGGLQAVLSKPAAAGARDTAAVPTPAASTVQQQLRPRESPGSPDSASTALNLSKSGLSTGAATAAAAAAAAAVQPTQTCCYQPPGAHEGSEVAAEYEAYAKRWAAGSTLQQRWQRLAASGKRESIGEQWQLLEEELFLDSCQATLQQLREQQQAMKPAKRSRSRAELDATAATEAAGAARQVRNRRAPSRFVAENAADAPSLAVEQTGLADAEAASALQGLTQKQQQHATAPAAAAGKPPRSPTQQQAAALAAAAQAMARQLGSAFSNNPAALSKLMAQMQHHRLQDASALMGFMASTLAAVQQQQQPKQ